MCLEFVWLLDLSAQDLVVVDLAVDCERNGPIRTDKRLGSRVYRLSLITILYLFNPSTLTNTNDTETLVNKDCRKS